MTRYEIIKAVAELELGKAGWMAALGDIVIESREKVREAGHDRAAKIQDLADALVKDGEVEVDHGPETEISEGDDNGAYVQAWLWVPFAGTEFDKQPENDEP